MSTTPELYCFRCAEPMRREGSELTCSSGAMALSKLVETTLLERFGSQVTADAEAPDRSGAWYCPGCRTSLADDLTCARCEQTLRDLRFQLVELHPHR